MEYGEWFANLVVVSVVVTMSMARSAAGTMRTARIAGNTGIRRIAMSKKPSRVKKPELDMALVILDRLKERLVTIVFNDFVRLRNAIFRCFLESNSDNESVLVCISM